MHWVCDDWALRMNIVVLHVSDEGCDSSRSSESSAQRTMT
jgi:hypothetical protein